MPLYRNPASIYRSYAVGSGPFDGQTLPQPQPIPSSGNDLLGQAVGLFDRFDDNTLLIFMGIGGLMSLYALSGGTGILGKNTPGGKTVGALIPIPGIALAGYAYLKRKGSI